jgi:hypothetical protein
MDKYNMIRPPPGFEHLFPVVEFPERRDYLVRIDTKDTDTKDINAKDTKDTNAKDTNAKDSKDDIDCALKTQTINETFSENELESETDDELEYMLNIPECLQIPSDRDMKAFHTQYNILEESDDNSSDVMDVSDDNSSDVMDVSDGDEAESKNISNENKPKSDKVKWIEDISQRKIFVGNVPFNCSQEEFEGCFTNVLGVYKADIVKGYRDDSRGIGFITMNSIADAEDLKTRDDIKCKGRTLRFYPYQNNVSKNTTDNSNNYVYIDGIPDGMDRKWLKDIFSEYQPFHRYFVAVDLDTGERKTTGFIDIVDDYKYDRLLSSKFHGVIISDEDRVPRAIPISDSKGKPRRAKDQKYVIYETTPILSVSRYRQKTLVKNNNRNSTRKDQLLSAMIIEEHKGHARERSGKRFRR